MARTEYQQELTELRELVLEMSDLVCHRLKQALEALETKDDGLAEAVITGDHEINERYLEIEQQCVDLLALQQPVAGDLRFIAASFKIITDLERIADLAVNLAEYTQRAERDRYGDVDVGYIGERTVEMVEMAMAGYEADDAATAHDIAATDDEIDTLCANASEVVVRSLIDVETAAAETERVDEDALLEDVWRMLLTIRDVERVGDHAVNIAARTLYMVENDDDLIY
ncbi:phosphate signaling complex protein PhoU [Natronorubrum daqingense]|uniref:Phosphate-specific transport system accessory protein PhoU n=1 Tax=Natronorubrum daqingense TaxID=588898 RepID=A0A1N7AHB2_9EURY|nr:phosphate signaling complex protein PhoU [Natronorubrum daqingense]APX97984.1 phosphate transport system regulatory protein PhoU [Natronorubrum daqingense]SIR38373.1 phosphate transport system protein [Natronorubrum daqingense]